MPNRRLFPVLTVSLSLGIGGLLAGIAWTAPVPKAPAKITETEIAVTPATDDKDKMAKNQEVSAKNLEKLATAFHKCAEENEGALPRDSIHKNGTKLLSWRVHVLPYIEEKELYKQFKLDEPWDSENNLKLVERMPKILASPRVSVKVPGFTVYQGFAGPGSLFQPGAKLIFPFSITDGTSNTIMIAESSVAVPWTKPADLPFDLDKDLPDFGKAYGSKPLVAMCDGSSRIVDTKTVSATTLKAAITINGGEVLGADW
ncbi:MAG TPA: DUF1559 domain-containing protein [Gemmata sp.]|jgi:hypothetical protein|nr:DUF1559 domain-containing protein [Gemmata sp.]